MPVSKVQLTGGSFQDAEGNLLSGGYLIFKLSQDGSVNDSQICAGIEIKVTLDGYGAIIAGQYVWGNDQLSPVNSYYTVTGYKSNGQPAWGPNNQQITGNGGTFDVGTWIPNSVISWFPSIQIRKSAIFYTIDGSGAAISTGAKGQLDIPIDCIITGWVLTADQSGSAVIDVLRSTYSAFPTTLSIASSDKPTLASAQKNENLTVSVWTTALSAGDQLQFNVNSASTVTRLNLTILVTIP